MDPREYEVTLTGGPTTILLHHDNIEGQAMVERWRAEHKTKKQVKGDDRVGPAWTWKIYLYSDGQRLVMPWLNVQSCVITAATEFKQAGKRASLKNVIPVALSFPEDFEFIPAGRKTPISAAEIDAIKGDDNFDEHVVAAAKLGIILDVRPVKVGQSRHIRVRPRFAPGWTARGTVINSKPDVIDDVTLQQIFEYCGQNVGLGDWRPRSPKKPGPHGRFTVEVARK